MLNPPMAMTLRGRQRLTDREGKILKAYRDSKGIPTIGVGHAFDPPVKMGTVITPEECDALLVRDLAKFERVLNKALTVPTAPNEFDALLSIMFNVGEGFAKSTAIRLHNAGDKAGAAKAIMLWNKPKEIIGRRSTERSQYLTPYA